MPPMRKGRELRISAFCALFKNECEGECVGFIVSRKREEVNENFEKTDKRAHQTEKMKNCQKFNGLS